MTSNRPYLIRAIYDWLVDNELTPYIMVETLGKDVVVPESYIEENRIVLNVSMTAVRDLNLGNDLISFSARFGGNPMMVSFPPAAVLGLYARENGQGMLFPEEEVAEESAGQDSTPDDPPDGPPKGGGRPALRVVK